jgi:hypothetical protein
LVAANPRIQAAFAHLNALRASMIEALQLDQGSDLKSLFWRGGATLAESCREGGWGGLFRALGFVLEEGSKWAARDQVKKELQTRIHYQLTGFTVELQQLMSTIHHAALRYWQEETSAGFAVVNGEFHETLPLRLTRNERMKYVKLAVFTSIGGLLLISALIGALFLLKGSHP